MKIAVIDLGTNTCNLLIAETKGAGYTILFQGKEPVRLIHNNTNEKYISPGGFQRAQLALEAHLKTISQFSVAEVKLIATSAVRDAANRAEFVKFVREKTGLETQVVTGGQEAGFIQKGVLLAFGKLGNVSLILDIGGGSNELIISEGKNILWKDSIAAGMSRVINRFRLSNPLTPSNVMELVGFFSNKNREAIERCREAGVATLIGCSGAFDTIADIIDQATPNSKQRIKQEILLSDFNQVYTALIASTREGRLAMKGMDQVRVDLIVPAVILIKQIVEEAGIRKIFQTDYALREGVLFEQMNNGNGK